MCLGGEKERRTQVHELNREVATNAVGRSIHDLTSMFEGNEKVAAWLRELEADLVENIGLFTSDEREQFVGAVGPIGGDVFRRYTVNVIVNNSPDATPEPTAGNSNGGYIGGGAPIITEEHPAFANLIGRVEHISQMGALVTDFSLIKAGSLHRANGGYLLIDALRLLREPLAWDGLKRALRTGRIVLEAPGDYLSLVSTVALEPDPIPLDMKVILFGDRLLYYLLSENDPEFRDLFKVSADFDDQIDRDMDTDIVYAEMVATLCRENDLLPLTAEAVGRVIEQSSRLAEDAEKLSLEVESVTDLLQEADLYARDDASDAIDLPHIQQAIDERVHRADRLPRKKSRSHHARSGDDRYRRACGRAGQWPVGIEPGAGELWPSNPDYGADPHGQRQRCRH